ncbi:MAG TPA: alanine racemase [Bacteroidota bacterium]|nr:alanine racemase [Bacteroidota bacterium]
MRITRAEINLQAVKANLEAVRRKAGPSVGVMGIVKANAYGHGIIEIAHALNKFGIDYLGVGFLEEGILLRNHGITAPILVLGGVLGSQVDEFLEYQLDITVSSVEIAEKINAEAAANPARRPRVHLKIDTGMERLGVRWEHAERFIEHVARLPHLDVIGIYSHFATADERDKSFVNEQMSRFSEVLRKSERLGLDIRYRHIANSGALLDVPSSLLNMVRPGILIYGIYPSMETSESVDVKPVLSLKSKVVYLKEIMPGMSVSYGRQFVADRRTRIATVPIGYGDGYSRQLSNRANVLIRGGQFRVVGAVCMDQVMVDVGLDAEVHVGDDVTLIGKDGSSEVTVWQIARWMNTLPYEVLTNIAARVPRYYFE